MPDVAPHVRWDRVGRVALLFVLLLLALLYVNPLRSYVSTWRESEAKGAEVTELEREHARLKARRAALQDPLSLEGEARRLGMVRPNERAFVVKGLSAGD